MALFIFLYAYFRKRKIIHVRNRELRDIHSIKIVLYCKKCECWEDNKKVKYSSVTRNEPGVFVRKLHIKPSFAGPKTRLKSLLGMLVARIVDEQN
jgi:hypothetical protein